MSRGSKRLSQAVWPSSRLPFAHRTLWIAALLGGLLFEIGDALAQTSPATLPDLKLSAGGTVTALAVQDDGKILIAGSFQSVNDMPRAGLARLNPDGSVDIAWNPYVVTSPNSPLSAIVSAGTNIYVGGGNFFINNNQTDSREFARLDFVNGSADQSWNPAATGGAVFAIASSGTNIYLGGTFTSVAGLSRPGLARINSAGAIDPGWNPKPDGPVQQMLVAGADLFVAGGFAKIGGQSRSGLAKLSIDTGNADPNWNPNLQGGSRLVRAVALAGTNLFVAGDFLTVGNISRSGLAKLSAEAGGDVDQDWNPFSNNGGTTPFSVFALVTWNDSVFLGGRNDSFPFLAKVLAEGNATVDGNWAANVNATDAANQNGNVGVLAVSPGGLLVGGTFVRLGETSAGGTPSLGIGKLDSVTGQRDRTFQGQAQIPGTAYAIARQVDGRVIVGGSFQSAGGLARANLVRIRNSGDVDPTWSPDTDGSVYALAVAGNDLFVGGVFTKAGGLARTNLAKINTLGFDVADSAWDAGITNGPAAVQCLAVSADRANLFVGGGSSGGWGRIGQKTGHNFLVKLTTGNPCRADSNWTTDTANEGVSALAVDGMNLFVGGSFTNIGGLRRIGLAKVSTGGAGDVDPKWDPGIPESVFTPYVSALAVSGANLFAGGLFTNINGAARSRLAKLSTDSTGLLDPLWAPAVVPNALSGFPGGIAVLAVSDTNLYVAGAFSSIGGQSVANVARVTGLGIGGVDASFAPNPPGYCYSLLVSGNDVYVGGNFSSFAGAQRIGLAFQPVADAPVLIQDSATNLFVFRNPVDGPEVTHFRIISTGDLPLYLSDGVTRVLDGGFITVAQGSAGLIFVPNGVITVAGAVDPTPGGAGSASSTLTMGAVAAPVFAFASGNYSVREGQGNIVVQVRKFGSGAAEVSYTTVDQTATGGVDYQTKSGVLNFSDTDKFKNIVIAIADDLLAEGDEQFQVRLYEDPNANQNGAVASPGVATVVIVDNDTIGSSDSFATNSLPALAPPSTGVLLVTLQPTGANGQWRLLGELNWHNSADAVTGLLTDNYQIEFRPVAGYVEPQPNSLPIIAGVTNVFSFDYITNGSSAMGNLTVRIEPPDVATNSTNSLRGQWQRPGEPNWHDSGEVISNLTIGDYSVEFKSIDGHLTPQPQSVTVGTVAIYGVTATYLIAPPAGVPPNVFVVPPDAGPTNPPYNGQIQTSVGFGSGFVVKPRVVLTAAHVLFDDVSLANVTEVRWFFQRYRDRFEPVPQVPRGWYAFEGYAAQRQADNSPGVSTPASQQLDAAAMYFLEPAGRGGFAGYLSSDADDNEYLLNSADKFLAGYPLDGVAEADQGKLHASMPTNLAFVHLYSSVFSTTGLQSYPGNSGGPLYVQTDAHTFYPAAIYLGGSGQTLVRAISSDVVDLINRAEISGNGGGNSTGGGVTIIRIGVTTQPAGFGTVTVSLSPSNAVNVVPGWRVHGAVTPAYYTDPVKSVSLYAGSPYVLEFKPVPGFSAPVDFTLDRLQEHQEVTLLAEYTPISPVLEFSLANGLSLTGATGAHYRVESSAHPWLAGWTVVTNVTLTNTTFAVPNTRNAPTGSLFYRAALAP